jgi:glutamate/tyrosine decarboxylase-like PLP-dependent enzyme
VDESPAKAERIATELERLARELRAGGRAAEGRDQWSAPPTDTEARDRIGETIRNVRGEADRAVAEAVRVLDRSVDAARAAILEAEREARERILAVTEVACRRIEAADHAQARLMDVIDRAERTR